MIPTPSPPRKFWLVAAAMLFLAGAGIWWRSVRSPTLREADELYLTGDFRAAESAAVKFAEHAPPEAAGAGFELAYRAALQDGRPVDAINHADQIPDDAPEFRNVAADAADIAVHQLREFSRAERLLLRGLHADRQNTALTERLAYLYGLTGRAAVAEPLRLELIRQGVQTWTLLWLLCLADDALENTELLEHVSDTSKDPLALFALARFMAERGQPERGRGLLRQAIQQGAPIEASILAGRLAHEFRDDQELDALLTTTSQHAGSAMLWWLRGLRCEELGRIDEAIRAHAEAVQLQPNLSRSLVALSRLLDSKGNSEIADRLRRRAVDLAAYLNAVKGIRQERGRRQWIQVTRLAHKLSLGIETAGWWSLGAADWKLDPEMQPIGTWVATQIETAQRQAAVSHAPNRLSADVNLLAGLDVRSWPEPRFTPSAASPQKTAPHGVPGIRWNEVAAATGLDFTFTPYPGRTASGPRMFEFTGGGVALVDFDRDGWLDTWWGQGRDWPARQRVPPGRVENSSPAGEVLDDTLFRNRAGSSWKDVTTNAHVVETGFSQGVSAADLNGDGFAELIVANIGETVIHWNHGDGTFSARPVPMRPGWSTSVAVADLSGDEHPDLYVTRYLGGADIFDRTCPDSEGHPHSCLPQHFLAEPDCYLQSTGDGEFLDATEAAGFTETDGKGLGIVAADFTGDGRLDLFVANDTTPNFLWVGQPSKDSSETNRRYVNEGLARGLALNGEGRAQADMGIALDDADGNGLFDLFVTKFFNESNTLSLQVQPGEFIDATGGSGLGQSSLRMLGFGTQFVDADLDSWPDLILVNGHIDDARHRGEPFEMRPQFYRNLGKTSGSGTRFEELRAADIGDCFARETLGRGLAKGDWNHDGLEDVFASHIGSRATLYENQTPVLTGSKAARRWVSLELVGTRAVREPIGARIELESGGTRYTKVLSSGDGYLSCNARRITFGLGDADRIDSLTVHWPEGSAKVAGVDPGGRWLVVEGRAEAVRLP